jgi:hypothetical protein
MGDSAHLQIAQLQDRLAQTEALARQHIVTFKTKATKAEEAAAALTKALRSQAQTIKALKASSKASLAAVPVILAQLRDILFDQFGSSQPDAPSIIDECIAVTTRSLTEAIAPEAGRSAQCGACGASRPVGSDALFCAACGCVHGPGRVSTARAHEGGATGACNFAGQPVWTCSERLVSVSQWCFSGDRFRLSTSCRAEKGRGIAG